MCFLPSADQHVSEADLPRQTWVPPGLFLPAKCYVFGNVLTSLLCHFEHFSGSYFLTGGQSDLQAQILHSAAKLLKYLGQRMP